MTQFDELARPEGSTGAGFHTDQARRPVHEELDELRTLELLAHRNFAPLINAVHLERVFANLPRPS